MKGTFHILIRINSIRCVRGVEVESGLLIIGLALLLVSYFVAVKKQTWLLAGFNEKAIKNKDLLCKVAGGGFFLPLGLLVVIHSFIEYPC